MTHSFRFSKIHPVDLQKLTKKLAFTVSPEINFQDKSQKFNISSVDKSKGRIFWIFENPSG